MLSRDRLQQTTKQQTLVFLRSRRCAGTVPAHSLLRRRINVNSGRPVREICAFELNSGITGRILCRVLSVSLASWVPVHAHEVSWDDWGSGAGSGSSAL